MSRVQDFPLVRAIQETAILAYGRGAIDSRAEIALSGEIEELHKFPALLKSVAQHLLANEERLSDAGVILAVRFDEYDQPCSIVFAPRH